MKYIVAFIVTTLILLCFVIPASAQTNFPYSAEGWYIDSFTSDVQVQPSGTVKVTETIIVDFTNLEKHGIYRDIPVVYEKQDGGKTYTNITVQSVSIDGALGKYEQSENMANMRIKIGDPDKTISGKHIYTISYEATGVIVPYDTYDELYWNATGNDWPVPILLGRSTITIPSGEIIQSACYVGVAGSTLPCAEKSQAGSVVTFSTNRAL